jgi:DNA-binding transcriptional MerR regulator/methylmalonyl-CoA mutase cobalamin-binding subunit
MLYSIAAVERDTGLSKDTLRVWERRYGFPCPDRDAAGDRCYPANQVERLRTIRRLLDAGHRPGRIVGLAPQELQTLASVEPPQARAALVPASDALAGQVSECLRAVEQHDMHALRQMLGQAALRMGLVRFVTALVAPLTTAVGEAWMQGRIQVYEEHLYTECMTGVLRSAIAAVPAPAPEAVPRVLLTTLPQEAHGLGLLMAQALLALEGCHCLSLGPQTPIADIAQAVQAERIDIVALSFTSVMGPQAVHLGLKTLRAQLPATAQIWAGGRGAAQGVRGLAGVRALPSLGELHPEVALWRTQHASV